MSSFLLNFKFLVVPVSHFRPSELCPYYAYIAHYYCCR